MKRSHLQNELRRSRERAGISTRSQIQQARYLADQGAYSNAVAWADAAAQTALIFARCVKAEAREARANRIEQEANQ